MRPLFVWIAFAACLAVVLAAMGWVSATVLRLDAASAAAEHQAVVEENVRLALWRMDSALAPLIARESTWPYFAYNPFYPAQRAYTNMFLPIRQGEVLVPSPLLRQPAGDVLLHFLIGPSGRFTSPQVPTDRVRELAETGFTTPAAIQLAAERLTELKSKISRDPLWEQLQRPDSPPVQIAMLPAEPGQPASQPAQVQARRQSQALNQPAQRPSQFDLVQRAERQQELIAANSITDQQVAVVPQNSVQSERPSGQGGKTSIEWQNRATNFLSNAAAYNGTNNLLVQQPIGDVHEGMTRPVWLGDTLILARRVLVGRDEYVVGCWLDWPGIEQRLVKEIRDLLPNGRLEPIRNGHGNSDGRMLAALPMLLVPGPVPLDADRSTSPLRMSLMIAWVCALLAAAAVAVLLAGALSLSERRGRSCPR